MTTASKSVALVKPETYLRSSILGTQVINQANAERLGIINQIWVDPEQMQVLVFEVGRQAFSGSSLTMELSQVTALGRDAILVSSEEVFDELDLTGLAKITGCQVLTTETGIVLGKVKDFLFNSASGLISELILSRLGIPLLPGYIDSTYRMQADDVLSVGDRRIIVAEGTDTRLTIQQKSIFEQLNIATPSWRREPGDVRALPRSFDEQEEDVFEDEYEEDYEGEYGEEVDAFDEVYAEDESEREPVPRRPRPPRQPAAPPAEPEAFQPESSVTTESQAVGPSDDGAAAASTAGVMASDNSLQDPDAFSPVPPPEATAWEEQPEENRSSSSG